MITQLIPILKQKGVVFVNGLSDAEVTQIEAKFGVLFPPDLKELLQAALPSTTGFADWRYGLNSKEGEAAIRQQLHWPLEGMLFDVESNAHWMKDWGPRPADRATRTQIATAAFARYPQLIPIYSHRYLPSRPRIAGNPVFSVYQTDIIYYGFDLADYLSKEFRFELPPCFERLKGPRREIEHWGELEG
jgi:hypothetical protein